MVVQVDGKFPSTTRTLLEVGNLTIVHLNENDTGLYECIASNFVADVITTALLVVHSRYSLTPHLQSTAQFLILMSYESAAHNIWIMNGIWSLR